MAAEAFAPAKVNLALHVTGLRSDGYHLLDSLVAFADVGDTVAVEGARDGWGLSVNGEFALELRPDPSNLVLKAARLTEGPPALLTLTKRLPIAAGLGGGSSDAAAALRALHAFDGRAIPDDVLPLGADLPVCLTAAPARMRGIGEDLSPLPPLPPVWMVLVNPRRGVSTRSVYGALERKDNAPMPEPGSWPDAGALADWLKGTRNDLEAPARSLQPAIDAVLSDLAATDGCLFARMSGSGATCFGLFATQAEARAAERALGEARSNWWTRAARVLPGPT